MLPVTLNLAREKGLPPSQLLMPLSFAASLGTTITIIGAPAFLIASDILRQAGRPGLGIFSIAPIGIALSLAGTAFIVLLGRWLLPARAGAVDGADRFRLDEYFTELTILEDSPFRDKTVRARARRQYHREPADAAARPTLILLAVFAVVAVLTQFMSDAVTTALFGPVAVALAQGLGHPPEPYVVTVAMASVAAFLTPIGHHGNLLIYGPGGYHFADFVRVGAPLTAIVAVIVVLLARLLWSA
jgi:di/tricarboxylate transporter